jgi:hypothetical protein
MSKSWEIAEGTVDSRKFFETLGKYFPDATTLYVEGTSISDDVQACYLSHQEPGPYVPPAQTLLPISAKYRCRFSPRLIAQLATLADQHAEPEVLDHLSLYKGLDELLCWHDAFDNVMLVSRNIPETRVAEFASALSLSYR